MDYNIAQENFEKFVNQFDKNNKDIMIRYHHTKMVVRLMEKVSRRMNLSDNEVILAKIIGLLHDIGRFKQIELSGKADDQLTKINHAELGCKYLFDENHIRDFITENEYDEIIKSAIFNHNRFEIEQKLNDKSLFFAKLIRDIDKIDILRVVAIHEEHEIIEEEIEKRVLDDFNNQKLINHQDIKNKSDKTIQYLSYIFDINFKESFELLEETDNLGLFISSLHIPRYSEDFANDCFKKVNKKLKENID